MLGVPVGHSTFVQKWLADKEGSHLQLLARIPAVQDTQCAWLLLLMCGGPGRTTFSATCPPSEPSEFGQHHHNHLRACLADIIAMAVPDGVTTDVVQLPFRGPIGTSGPLRSTWMTDSANVVFWPPQIRLFTGRPVKTWRDPRGNFGSHLSGSKRSGEGEPVALRIEHNGANDGPAKNRGYRERPSFLGRQAVRH